jgi:YidC/Oxa1 family membrane protein insertase
MPNTPNDEQFIQRRMLMAAVLSAVVMGGYIYLAPRPEPPQQTPAEVAGTPTSPPVPISGPQGGAGVADAVKPSGTGETDLGGQVVEASREQTVTVESDTFFVEFTNRGAVVKSWELKNFKDSIGEPLDLVHQGGATRFGRPFRLVRPGGERIAGADEALFAVNSGPPRRQAPETLVFNYAKDGLRIRKTFAFEADGHIVRVATEVSEAGRPQRHLFEWGGGFGDTAQAGNTAYSQTFYYDDGDIQYTPAADAEDERISRSGPFPFVGVADLFFTAAAIPEPGNEIRVETSAVEIIPAGAEPTERQQFVAAAFGGEPRNSVRLYVGPKSRDALAGVDGVGSAFGRIVDFGFFAFIAEPLFLMLRWVYFNIVSNWGWSIVIVTILINTILFPLKYKSTKSMRKMQQLQPLVKQINNKYKGVTMRDPRKSKQNEELQALYKKYKASPMGGCLPILLQMPFFFAFYKLLTVAIEMRQAEWLWVSDLSNPETLAIRVLPLAMVATQFWSQSLTPTPTADATQARLMKFMPLVFGFIFYQFQAGLVLYWLTSNCVGIAQQLILNRLPTEKLDIQTGRRRSKRRKRRR